MNYIGIKVLLVEGYARQILPYLRAYKQLGCETYVICNSKLDVGYVSKYTDHRVLGICNPSNYVDSEKFICETIRNGSFDIVVPMGDFAAKILATNKRELSTFAKIAVNDSEIIDKAMDKLYVMDICMKKGIACPETFFHVNNFDDVLNLELKYPLVVKPKSDSGARGFHCFYTKEELLKFSKENDLSTKVVQEYIPQTDLNMSCGLFLDNAGEVKSSYVYISRRWYPIKGGTGTLNQLVWRPDVVEVCKKLANEIGLVGTVGFDLIQDARDNVVKVIEINPRVLACAKIGFVGGVNQALQLLQKEYDQEIDCMDTFKEEIFVRMSQIDILWFLKSPNRFSAKPSWFKITKTKDQLFVLNDPLPWFSFLLQGVLRFKKECRERT